jgi:hypothetical protein
MGNVAARLCSRADGIDVMSLETASVKDNTHRGQVL